MASARLSDESKAKLLENFLQCETLFHEHRPKKDAEARLNAWKASIIWAFRNRACIAGFMEQLDALFEKQVSSKYDYYYAKYQLVRNKKRGEELFFVFLDKYPEIANAFNKEFSNEHSLVLAVHRNFSAESLDISWNEFVSNQLSGEKSSFLEKILPFLNQFNQLLDLFESLGPALTKLYLTNGNDGNSSLVNAWLMTVGKGFESDFLRFQRRMQPLIERGCGESSYREMFKLFCQGEYDSEFRFHYHTSILEFLVSCPELVIALGSEFLSPDSLVTEGLRSLNDYILQSEATSTLLADLSKINEIKHEAKISVHVSKMYEEVKETKNYAVKCTKTPADPCLASTQVRIYQRLSPGKYKVITMSDNDYSKNSIQYIEPAHVITSATPAVVKSLPRLSESKSFNAEEEVVKKIMIAIQHYSIPLKQKEDAIAHDNNIQKLVRNCLNEAMNTQNQITNYLQAEKLLVTEFANPNSPLRKALEHPLTYLPGMMTGKTINAFQRIELALNKQLDHFTSFVTYAEKFAVPVSTTSTAANKSRRRCC
jgi:hypothetical protein